MIDLRALRSLDGRSSIPKWSFRFENGDISILPVCIVEPTFPGGVPFVRLVAAITHFTMRAARRMSSSMVFARRNDLRTGLRDSFQSVQPRIMSFI